MKMWKINIAFAILFTLLAFRGWLREPVKNQWVYNVTYSFHNGAGRIFLTRSAPILSIDDVTDIEKYVISKNKDEGVETRNVFLTGWVELSGPKE